MTSARPTLLVLTPTAARHGGVESVLDDIDTGLAARGWRLVFGLARGRFHDPQAYRAAHPGLEALDLEAPTGTRLGRVRAIRNAVQSVRPEIVLNARLFDSYEAVATLKQRGAGPRFVTMVQAFEDEYLHDVARYADFVDLCLTSGLALADSVRALCGLPRECVLSIPGGVRPPRHVRVPAPAGGPLRLGYVGRLDQEQKRILDLPRVLARLDALGIPWTCRVAGSGPAEAALRERLAAQGLAERVTLLGWRSLEQLYAEVYPALDVFLHLAAFEGVTIAPREAMVHGVVPVITRFEGLEAEGHFVHERTALVFPVGDVEAAAGAIARLHLERALLARLGEAARESQQGSGSLEAVLDAWDAALRRVLHAPERVGATLPRLPAPSGRLAAWGLPPDFSEGLRRLTRRRAAAVDAGAEWPHWSGLRS